MILITFFWVIYLLQLKIEPTLSNIGWLYLIPSVNYVEILREINCKYQLKYCIEKYQNRLKSLISYQYRIVSNFPVSPITTRLLQ